MPTGTLRDPFSTLGPHDTGSGRIIRAFLPGAREVEVVARDDGHRIGTLLPSQPHGLFVGRVESREDYRLRISWPNAVQETEDPYAFTQLLLSENDLFLFNEGRLFELAFTLGAVPMTIDGVKGVRFAVWAPNARAVSVVGDFDTWDPRRHPMRLRYSVRRVGTVRARGWNPARATNTRSSAPTATACRRRPIRWPAPPKPPPATASVVADTLPFVWHDEDWMQQRARAACRRCAAVDLRSACRLVVPPGSWPHADLGRTRPRGWCRTSSKCASPMSS